jgi:CheY-like chemotaxis protein
MARVIIVDDDAASDILVESLGYFGHEARRIRSVDEALQQIDAIVSADLLVLDILMPQSTSATGRDTNSGRAPGMTVFQSVRKKNQKLPIVAFTAATDVGVVEALKRDLNTTFVPKWSSPSMQEFIGKLEKILGLDHVKAPITSFIIHGHDEVTKLAVKNYLQNTLKLPEPIVLHEKANVGRTVMEKFEHYANQSCIAFALLTPDDRVVPADASDDEKRRARQNVIFELGYFLGTLGRLSGRVILLYKGPLELPSDISGVTYIDIGKGVESAGDLIRRELENVRN